MITTVVLDIGQVLADFCWNTYLEDCGYGEEQKDRISRATVRSKVWGEQDRGKLKEEELIALCCEQDPGVKKEIRKLFEDLTKLVRPYDYSAGFIMNLKANGYKVYLLSNYGRRSFEYAKEEFEFIRLADGGVISYEVKHIKPEPEIYQALIEKYRIDPGEAVFLDDLEVNLAAAKEFGFHTIQVKEFKAALEELRALGVKI